MNALLNQLQDPNTQWVLMGTLLLGLASGVLGSFALLRKQSLLGDAMAHAALPGVCFAFLFVGEKSLFWFIVGATIAGLISTWCIQAIIKHSRIKEDSAIGIVLSVSFGFGIVLLTYIQHSSNGNQSGLDSFIFGQAASVIKSDVQLISVIALSLLILTGLFFKEFKLITFDEQFAKGLGIPTQFFNAILMLMIVLAVVIGLQTVGVVLMAAMLITPAIAARYWTEKLSVMIVISGIIGALSGVIGTLLSTVTEGMATGPLIVVAATSLFVFSLIFAPNRGLFSVMLKHLRFRRKTAINQILLSLYDLTEEKKLDSKQVLFSVDEIILKRPVQGFQTERLLNDLQKQNVVENVSNKWKLTEIGLEKAYNLALNQRLYEMYLMHEMEFSHLHLKDKEDFSLEQLGSDVKHQLMKLLEVHQRVPQLKPKGMYANEL
ncbi:metal ABC transporter permease [Bacillus carboniphilus]|uniref:Metal ABC transporter permease n=1 Tax=Bacillus carboniphilus TaxID=86663 RepID=A0ABY9JSG4_9BACI|nr:metal ABC transporter permease [Bacillus carboniphilus]WLR41193.1 metal ABC transporter permease [Bacillus carboniphilus]